MLVPGIGANIVRRHLVQAGFLFTVCVPLTERAEDIDQGSCGTPHLVLSLYVWLMPSLTSTIMYVLFPSPAEGWSKKGTCFRTEV